MRADAASAAVPARAGGHTSKLAQRRRPLQEIDLRREKSPGARASCPPKLAEQASNLSLRLKLEYEAQLVRAFGAQGGQGCPRSRQTGLQNHSAASPSGPSASPSGPSASPSGPNGLTGRSNGLTGRSARLTGRWAR